MDGLLVVDKPAGPTSHDVVARMRRVLGERRVGHTGTLDPMATGVLSLVVGRGTRLARFLSAGDKTYEAEVRLGVSTDTYDRDGSAVGAAHQGPWPSRDEIDRALDAFRGQFLQQPPAFSAKKIAGRRSYRIARAGSGSDRGQIGGSDRGQIGVRSGSDQGQIGVRSGSDQGQTPIRSLAPVPVAIAKANVAVLRPVLVTAHAIDVLAVDGERVSLRIDCSAGFYVRSLAHDLGLRLGTGAHVVALRRTRSGDFSLADAVTLDAAERDHEAARAAVLPLERMLPGLAAIVLTDEGARRAVHGRDLIESDYTGVTSDGRLFLLIDRAGRLLGIGEADVDRRGILHPSVVLV